MEGEADVVVGSCAKPCGPLEDYRIPDYILKSDAQKVLVDHAPPCPVIVFINSRSGGQLGSSLIKTYRELLNEAQVPFLPFWKLIAFESGFIVRGAQLFSGL